jgi:uncharacterized protein YndB with AHSA1/START domain
MNPRPTGQLERTQQGWDLILTRDFRATLDDVWLSITEPDSAARWFGRWEGDAAPGKTVRLQMLFEEGKPWTNVTIVECTPPTRLLVSTKDDYGTWHLELTLHSEGDTTTLQFLQHLEDTTMVGEVGPGWEYYLDMLVAARLNQPLPRFDDYYPSQKPYYLKEAEERSAQP